METSEVILRQLATMAIYCLCGFILNKTKLISKEGCRAFSKLLIYIVLPCVIISSFVREAEPAITNALLICTGISVLLLFIAVLVSMAFLRNDPVAAFSASFSNAGFMGIPLITMALGNSTVLYIAPFVALLNILQWSVGQNLLLGKRRIDIKQALLNPLFLSFALGVLIYAMPFSVPKLITDAIGALAACNAPIAMIILGFYMAEVPLRNLVCTREAWFVSGLRLIIIPILSILAVAWLPGISRTIKTSLLIAASAPVGINVAIYAELLEKDYQKAVTLICNSSVLCVLTMPLIILLADKVIS